MRSDLRVCPHCNHKILVRLSSDIGVAFHWEGDYFLVDVVLLFSETPLWLVLYRQAYKKGVEGSVAVESHRLATKRG
jgi:hypothetical protein